MLQTLSAEALSQLTEAELSMYEECLHLYSQIQTPLKYMTTVSPEAVDFPHIQLLENHVLALIDHCLYPSGIGPQAVKVEADVWCNPETGEETCQFIAITMPPRHGKSFYVSWHLPAWYLTMFPDNQIILTTHESEFSEEWSDSARTLVREHPEFGVTIDPKNDSKSRWKIKGRRGALRCAGAGGSINGKAAHLLIGDDLIKNSEQAYSKVQRENLWNWYKTTWKTRREPDGVGIVMFTRWHEDDLIGRCLKRESRQWFLLNLPALGFEETDDEGYSVDPDSKIRDMLGRRPGEALCPERYSARALLRIKSGEDSVDEETEGGEIIFSAMFQGKPSIENGGLIRKPFCRYRYIKHPKDDSGIYQLFCKDGTVKTVKEADCWRFTTNDLAATLKERSDYTVLSVWDATKSGELIWRDCYRTKIESSDHVDFMMKHVPIFQKPTIKMNGIEKVTLGLSLMQNLRKVARKLVLFAIDPDKDKYARATPFGIAVAEGSVFFPEGQWPSSPLDDQCKLIDAEEELTKFPNAAHDDIVDTCSGAMEMWKMAPRERLKKSNDNSPQARAHRQIQSVGKKKRRRTGGRLGQ